MYIDCIVLQSRFSDDAKDAIKILTKQLFGKKMWDACLTKGYLSVFWQSLKNFKWISINISLKQRICVDEKYGDC